MSQVKIRRALISVSDKTELAELGRRLADIGVEIISSGGTGRFLQENGVACTPIESVTGNPECFGGRMKTLSFQVASALLFRRDHTGDQEEARRLGIAPIDLVVCNLYPFEAVAKRGGDWDELIENIDIGGPTLIRAAAKNYSHVAVVTDPSQYAQVLSGETTLEQRQQLARAAFGHTARYDGMVASRLEREWDAQGLRTVVLSPQGGKALRYGENPHQRSWVYTDPFNPGIAGVVPLQGKELSYNNMLDADAAWRCCGDLGALKIKGAECTVAIIKHLSPCGVAGAKSPLEALTMAWSGDPVSSFGGILCFNREVGEDIALWLKDKFVEVILAPRFSGEARRLFAAKKNLRLLELPAYDGTYEPPVVRSISGGWLLQQEDTGADAELRLVTHAGFPAEKTDAARFGIMACKHLKSNAIGLFRQDGHGVFMVGAGMGNPNRLVSMKQAVDKARENGHDDLSDVVLVSDAFFPFADNIGIAKEAGIAFIVQPGGSVNDNQVISACEEGRIAMVFTGRRHFRH